MVSLCPDIDASTTVQNLNESVDADTPANVEDFCTVEYAFQTNFTNDRIERFRQTLKYIISPTSSVADVLDSCLPADYVLLLLSATVEVPESSLNTLRSVLAQGTPSIIPIVTNLSAHSNPKTRAEVKKSLLAYICQYIPTVERVYAADDRTEASTVMRILCTSIPKGIRWREQRSYILSEGWRWDEEEDKIVFIGTIRGKPLQVNRLIHLANWGDFQIEKVVLLKIIYLQLDMFIARQQDEQIYWRDAT